MSSPVEIKFVVNINGENQDSRAEEWITKDKQREIEKKEIAEKIKLMLLQLDKTDSGWSKRAYDYLLILNNIDLNLEINVQDVNRIDFLSQFLQEYTDTSPVKTLINQQKNTLGNMYEFLKILFVDPVLFHKIRDINIISYYTGLNFEKSKDIQSKNNLRYWLYNL